MKRRMFRFAAIATTAFFCSCSPLFAGFAQQWTRILGDTNSFDSFGMDVSVFNNGDVYVAGHSSGLFDGVINPFGQSVCLTKWSSDGSKIWRRLLGSTNGYDFVTSMSSDEMNVYITGYSDGDLGFGNSGMNDAFLLKINNDSSDGFSPKMWGSPGNDYAYGVAFGGLSPNVYVYVVGSTDDAFGAWMSDAQTNSGALDAFITQWQPDGSSELWTRMWGSDQIDEAKAIVVDEFGNVYVAGNTEGSFGEWPIGTASTNPGRSSAFLKKFYPDGSDEWTRIWGSVTNEYVESITVDGSGAIYVAGYTYGDFEGSVNSGGADAFFSVFDPNGGHLWTHIFGSESNDYASAISVDTNSSPYIIHVSGYTYGTNFFNKTNNGVVNAFLTSWVLNETNPVNVAVFGSTNVTAGTGVAIGPDGMVHVSGYTKDGFYGELPVSPADYNDLFVTKFKDIPDTTPLYVWDLGEVVYASPAIGPSDELYIGAGSNFFELSTGVTQVMHTVADGAFISSGASAMYDAFDSIYVGASTGGVFYVLKDMSVVFSWDVSALYGAYGFGSPAIDTNGIVYVCSDAGYMFAFNSDTGVTQHVWSVNAPISISSPVLNAEGRIYVGADDGMFYAFNPDGTTQHVWEIGTSIIASPAIGAEGRIYVGSDNGNFYAFNPDGTTQHVWEAIGSIKSSPAIGSDGSIYIGSVSDGSFYSFHPNGTTQHVWTTSGPIRSSPAIASDGTVYVGSDDGNLYAFYPDGSTGSVYSTDGQISSSPTIASDGTVYVGSDDGKFYAFAGTSAGLAASPWPKFRGNIQNTGRSDFMPLLKPVNLVATQGSRTDAVRISWDVVSNATGYTISWGASNDIASASFLTGVSTTNFNHTTITPGMWGYYWVRATNDSGVSAFSDSVGGWRAMAAPAGPAATQGTYTSQVRINWSPVEGATGFEIRRNTSSDFGSSVLIGVSGVTTYDDLSVTAGRTYYYWMRGTNNYTQGYYSVPTTGYATETAQTGTLIIDIIPDGGGWVTPARGSWRLMTYPSSYTGPTFASGSYTNISAPVGSYKVRFEPLTWYYAQPYEVIANVEFNKEIKFVGNYYLLDSDGDGLSDWHEVNVYGTDPLNPDTDGDGYSDGVEVAYGTDPLDPDSYPIGSLNITSPFAGVMAKAGKLIPISWIGTSALGTADIYLMRSSNSWQLAKDVACNSLAWSNNVMLPRGLSTGTNYHVRVVSTSTSTTNMFGNSALFSIVGDCKGDYDGDGKADLSVYFPPWGMWFLWRSSKGFYYQQFGWNGPIPVPADYDGDGRTDFAVYDPPSGMWYILTWSWDFYWLRFGGPSLKPVPADYDGDGRTDFAVYEPLSGDWHILSWSGVYYTMKFGGMGMEPVPGDYEGDGLANPAVYNASEGLWHILNSSGNVRTLKFGGAGMIAVPNDYDGDGITDPAVYDPPSGIWYIFLSASSRLASVQFGFEGAKPLSGDYDGDGKADLGLWYGPLGLWYRLMSTEGLDWLQFGWNGVIPLD